MKYKETTIALSIPYFLIAFVMSLFLSLPSIGSVTSEVHIAAIILGIAAFGAGCYRVVSRREVMRIDDTGLFVIALEPGMWKLFQCWTKTFIPREDLVKIEIGNIGDGLKLGKWKLLGLDSSRNAVFQNVCVFHYKRDRESRCVFYPHTNNIKNFSKALSEMKAMFGDKIETF